MSYLWKKTIGKMSLRAFHDLLQDLEQHYKVIKITIEMLNKETVQVEIEYR